MNDIRTTDINLTVDQLRLIRTALGTTVQMYEEGMEYLDPPDVDSCTKEMQAMQVVLLKVNMEIEKVVGVMS